MNFNLPVLREAGFFADYRSLSDDELMAAIAKRRKDDYAAIFGYEYEPGEFSGTTEFLALDDKKFLDIDLEADVINGNDIYVSVLEDFAVASNGHFKPTEISEEWESDEGPVAVSFTSNGRQVRFEPEYMDDWIDGSVFDIINAEMETVSDERFVLCSGPDDEWFGQNVIHIRLTPSEKELLREKLGWKFPEGGGA